MSSYFTCAPFSGFQKHRIMAHAADAAIAYTKQSSKLVMVYECKPSEIPETLDLCRPLIAYVKGQSYWLKDQPWRSTATEFDGAFPIPEGGSDEVV